jgi:hypothetical protein
MEIPLPVEGWTYKRKKGVDQFAKESLVNQIEVGTMIKTVHYTAYSYDGRELLTTFCCHCHFWNNHYSTDNV